MANNTKVVDDFDIKEAFKTTINKNQPDQFAKFFKECSETQIQIKDTIASVTRKVIVDDKEVEREIKDIILAVIKEDKTHFFMRSWDKVKYLMNLIIGALLVIFSNWIMKKLGL